MKLAAYQYKADQYVGIVSDDLQTVTPYQLSQQDAQRGALTIIEMMAEGIALPSMGQAVPLKEVCLRAPIPYPRRNIFCVGKNYLDHVKEIKDSKLGEAQGAMANLPKHPVVFSKVPEAVIATRVGIDSHPAATQEMDYEAELAVVIAKKGKAIIILNPAEPPLVMRDTVFTLSEMADTEAIKQSIDAMVLEVQQYVPGYRLHQEVQFEVIAPEQAVFIEGLGKVSGLKTTVMLQVRGAGHYLPEYAGNLDIMTSAALATAEKMAANQNGKMA